MTRRELQKMKRKQLVEWLEGSRGMMCRDEDSVKELRETALDDFDRCGEEEGFAS